VAYIDAHALKRQLQRAMDLGRAGRLDAADDLLTALLQTYPSHPDVLQLSGMVARKRGLNLLAIDRFQQAIASGGGQAPIQNNLGNALLAVGRTDEALVAYRRAVWTAPDYLDAWINLGIALIESGKPAEAEVALGAAVGLDPRNAKAWGGLGRARLAADRPREAVEALETADQLRPDHVSTMHNLAVALRLSGDPSRALDLLRRCAVHDDGIAAVQYNMGHCLQDLGRFHEAAAAYRAAVAADPANREAHDSLNRLLWQTGGQGDYLKSYVDAIAAGPPVSGLYADLAYRMTLSGRAADAAMLLDDAIGRGIDCAEVQHRLGQAMWSMGQLEGALEHFEVASRAAPDNVGVKRELSRSLIILQRYRQARALLDLVLTSNPADQQAIAYRNLCLRLLRAPGAPPPDEADRLVAVIPLVPPAGEGNVAAFNARLNAALDPLHNMTNHPLEQTLRGGTQTIGDLFDRPIAEIRTLRVMIEKAVKDYIAALPDAADHPFLRRKSGCFTIAGSWSVRLRSEGHHMNHIHPEGWISSCYYVGLPPTVDTSQGHEGWLKLGESALGLGERERIDRLIKPRVGTLVLFPSYFYHGTVPFIDPTPRTTIAFDIVPV
jgi:tetratricopeptide (TPR) repeat protein